MMECCAHYMRPTTFKYCQLPWKRRQSTGIKPLALRSRDFPTWRSCGGGKKTDIDQNQGLDADQPTGTSFPSIASSPLDAQLFGIGIDM